MRSCFIPLGAYKHRLRPPILRETRIQTVARDLDSTAAARFTLLARLGQLPQHIDLVWPRSLLPTWHGANSHLRQYL